MAAASQAQKPHHAGSVDEWWAGDGMGVDTRAFGLEMGRPQRCVVVVLWHFQSYERRVSFIMAPGITSNNINDSQIEAPFL